MKIAAVMTHAAHRLAFLRLKCSAALAGENIAISPVRVMGLSFPGRIGAAAGLDRYGEFAHLAHRLGLGFVETGTVTPRPEPGANRGVDALLAHLSRQDRNRRRCRVGISIAANAATPVEETWRDLCTCMERAYLMLPSLWESRLATSLLRLIASNSVFPKVYLHRLVRSFAVAKRLLTKPNGTVRWLAEECARQACSRLPPS